MGKTDVQRTQKYTITTVFDNDWIRSIVLHYLDVHHTDKEQVERFGGYWVGEQEQEQEHEEDQDEVGSGETKQELVRPWACLLLN